MKRINYLYNIPVNAGDDEAPVWEEHLHRKSLPYSAEAEEIAKKEAYNGEYTIEDDGQPEQEAQPTDTERIAELEEALDMLISGVTE